MISRLIPSKTKLPSKTLGMPNHANQIAQEKFLKQCELINTKEDMGWYSKEDMSKVLHWNPILDALSGLWLGCNTDWFQYPTC